MTGPDRPMRLHVKLSVAEHNKLSRIRGDNKWRAWLLGIVDQIIAMRDRNEVLQIRVNMLEKDNDELREHVSSLIDQIESLSLRG